SSALVDSLDDRLAAPAFNEALALIWEFVHALNRYVDVSAPWSLAKDTSREADLDRVLYDSLEGLRMISLFISPFMPDTAARIWERIGMNEPLENARLPESAAWGLLPAGAVITRGEALFPRKETQPEDS
ncbi:MAG: class I tRNA ligase family protein, partial [Actinobacteria bacterium]|nr:class I tRNA ligase family protein [Actinomycetota bacterium]